MTVRILTGDCRDILPTLPEQSVQCVVTSPPWWGLRDYGHDDQIGLETTLDEYLAEIVNVFRLVRPTLTDDGTIWVHIGDSHFGGGYANHRINGETYTETHGGDRRRSRQQDRINANPSLKPKDLTGIPWSVAFALRDDGWFLRADVICRKRRGMPDVARDRPGKRHDHLFLLSKSSKYLFKHDGDATRWDVWDVMPATNRSGHHAILPEELVAKCIKATSRVGDTVLDPFAGTGTVPEVADQLGRGGVGIELNAAFTEAA